MSGGRTVVDITPRARIMMTFDGVLKIVEQWPPELQQRFINLVSNDKEVQEKFDRFRQECEIIRKEYRYQLYAMCSFLFLLIGWPFITFLLGLPGLIDPMNYMPPPWIGYVHMTIFVGGMSSMMTFFALSNRLKHVMSAKEMSAFVMKFITYIQQALQDNLSEVVGKLQQVKEEIRQEISQLKQLTAGQIGEKMRQDFPEMYQVVQKIIAMRERMLEGNLPSAEEVKALNQEIERAHQLYQERYGRKQEQQG